MWSFYFFLATCAYLVLKRFYLYEIIEILVGFGSALREKIPFIEPYLKEARQIVGPYIEQGVNSFDSTVVPYLE
jgi:hypothetical protein